MWTILILLILDSRYRVKQVYLDLIPPDCLCYMVARYHGGKFWQWGVHLRDNVEAAVMPLPELLSIKYHLVLKQTEVCQQVM